METSGIPSEPSENQERGGKRGKNDRGGVVGVDDGVNHLMLCKLPVLGRSFSEVWISCCRRLLRNRFSWLRGRTVKIHQ